MQYPELALLEKLQELTAADADFEYSVLRGKLDANDVRAIHQGLQVAIEALREATALRCTVCGAPIGLDSKPIGLNDKPKDGWALEDGRRVCQRCCIKDALLRMARAIDNPKS